MNPYEELLARGVDDWVSVAEVVALTEGDTVRAVALVQQALTEGTALAGTLTEEGFTAWPGDPALSAARIAAALSGGQQQRKGSIAWLCNTPSGDELGMAALDREARSHST
jgi:hypothetical protein